MIYPHPMSEKINLIGDYDHNSQQSLKLAVNQIQTKFDLHHDIIQKWLDQEDFQDKLNALDKKCYKKIICQQKHPVLNKLLDVTYPDTFVEENIFWEKEKCGQIIDEYKNGYIKYCNQHKYLHPNRKNPLKKQKPKTTSEAKIDTDNKQPPKLTPEQLNPNEKYSDHYFVEKNPKEILDEKIFTLMFNVYVQYSRALANSLESKFYKYLVEDLNYHNSYIQLDELRDNLEWFQTHPQSFRGKSYVFSSQKSESQDGVEYVKIYLHPEDEKSNSFRTLTDSIN